MPKLRLQPKQAELLDKIEQSQASWLGMGGGRGGAKSGALQRIMLARRMSLPGTPGVIVMRNYDQVQQYHVVPMLNEWPQLAEFYTEKNGLVIPTGGGKTSQIRFSYAEALDDVVRRFRSANNYDVFIDQAEQFTEAELREIKQSVRWPGTKQGACKLVLAFNMGGVGIDFLRKKFHLKEYNAMERAEDYEFIHVHPWDNVEWVRMALIEDGLTERDYYEAFTEEQRMQYCASRGDYGRNLVSQDEALRKRDWLGSWESLEGAFFGRVFDRDKTVLSQEQVAALIKPWNKRWLSQDWGRGHYCSTHWHARVDISQEDARNVLGWEVQKPLRAVITYREYIAGGAAVSDEGGNRELAEQDIAREIVARTPQGERGTLDRFFLSPDAFAKKTSANTIAEEEGDILKAAGLPRPDMADNDRAGGWALMYNLLLSTKRMASIGDEVWFISANCPEIVRTIPLLMRDPDNLDDVLKTDKGAAKLEQDVADDVRYGLKSMLGTVEIPKDVQREAVLAKSPNHTQRHIDHLKFEVEYAGKHKPITKIKNWRTR